MLLAFFGGGWAFWPAPRNLFGFGVLFFLLLLLGWKVFGAPLHT